MIMMMKKKMSLFLFTFLSLSSVLVGQQEYIGKEIACSDDSYLANGYSCNKSCMSVLTFRSTPYYYTLDNITDRLDAYEYVVVSPNIFSSSAKIPFGQLVAVPVTCSCSANNISQYDARYTVIGEDIDYLAKYEFQGLTSCQAISSRNMINLSNMPPFGTKLFIPLRCACPNQDQINNQNVDILVTYIVQENDTLDIIGETFGGVTVENIMKANMLSSKTIYPSTPILVPLKMDNCTEKPNSFYCVCPSSFVRIGTDQCENDRYQGNKKFPVKWIASIGIGTGLGLLSLMLFSLILYRHIKKRQAKALKKKMFEQNGGLILQQKLAYFGNTDKARIFTSEELERATENYSRSRVLGQGGHGTVYKGMLEDGTIVAVKRSKAIDKERIEQFVNEVVILSQINHRNIVNLLGCCLETQVPILIYEYISNGTLSSHIHRDCEPSLSWEDRFRVACEVAGAVAYMHSATSIPIFHRDIKPSNILLDDNFVAKVSDFGTSRSVPDDKTHLTTAVIKGTLGYLDPEYLQWSKFTDKSDVYSFGVVLVELLTGEKPASLSEEDQQGRNTVANFVSMTKLGRLLETLHPRVVEEAKYEVCMAVAMLGLRCLRLNGKKRPSMKELAMELEGLRNSQKSGGELSIDEVDESFYRNDVQGVESRMSISINMESTTIPR